MPSLIKRSALAEYLNVAPAATAPVWKRIGFGVESKSVDYETEFDERQFIHEDSKNSSVKSHGYSSEFDMNAQTDSELFDYLDTLRITGATYGDAETDHLEVRLYKAVDGETDVFEATKRRVTIAVSGIGDAAEDPLTSTVSIKGKGDPEQGTFDYTDSTYTAA